MRPFHPSPLTLPFHSDVYRANSIVENFEQILANVFGPLFEVTLNASSHAKLYIFLKHCIGFDSVDDESKPEHHTFSADIARPNRWSQEENPP